MSLGKRSKSFIMFNRNSKDSCEGSVVLNLPAISQAKYIYVYIYL